MDSRIRPVVVYVSSSMDNAYDMYKAMMRMLRKRESIRAVENPHISVTVDVVTMRTVKGERGTAHEVIIIGQVIGLEDGQGADIPDVLHAISAL